ncbi:MAG: glycine dehydrogenase (aminomethyl-transferring) [Chitinophagales bacterium]|nr:MAG: glycine dehydrogenase (aminomethyl-transferring) [Chitinophagales bacterium]
MQTLTLPKIFQVTIHLNSADSFEERHIGPRAHETREMLRLVNAESLDALIMETIPETIRLKEPLNLPDALSEYEFLRELRETAALNRLYKSYIGLGYYNCITPPVLLRNIFQNPGWYTQYTPYQAEISQGRLEALLNFQTMICDLTGLPVANASLLDEATAAAEAMLLLYNNRQKKAADARVFLVSDKCFPQTIEVLKTRALPLGIQLHIGNYSAFEFTHGVFGLLLQYPDADGAVNDYHSLIAEAHAAGVSVVMAADLLSLTLLKPPGELGADIAVGSAQRFGVPLGYGGPHAAFFAVKEEFKRLVPGRIIGVSIDSREKPALRMALQTREQHIRREKATSNICTAQALLAIMAGMYAAYHGPHRLKKIASRIHLLANILEKELTDLGYSQLNSSYFDTLKIAATDQQQQAIRQIAEKARINLRYAPGFIGIALDETVLIADLEQIVNVFAVSARKKAKRLPLEADTANYSSTIPAALQRTSTFLTHPVFNSYHSETQMMRYIKSLERKDISLTHSMIPLGSCTMKLNAATQLMPVSWSEFADIHPFVPAEQAEGYARIIRELENYLREITRFSGVSLQPNSGAQGEYAGLMVIRAYQNDIGQGHRNVALIPSSAHGTNPASAVMAGLEVVVVKCDAMGNIDLADLKEKAERYKDRLSVLMITYPSTHGVFEENIREVCAYIHACGGQVYMDGANLNAQVGLTSPASIGADVCHINLHKTFSIPHGGGGPGMGPICVAAHLTPYLPGHPLVKTGGAKAITPVSAAPWGSASILIISYAYIRLLGKEGITNASRYAILNANYIKTRLEKHFKVLYAGKTGRVAHELIIDLREFKYRANIEVDDVAKRLMDYGFHAPTVSFPVAGTLMIEPTESESKDELDRFCDALIHIRREIQEIENRSADEKDNVLKNAPHTADEVTADKWTHPYSRQKAAFPLDFVRSNKFWPPVSRVNNPYGDRNLVCTCPPVDSYSSQEAAEHVSTH